MNSYSGKYGIILGASLARCLSRGSAPGRLQPMSSPTLSAFLFILHCAASKSKKGHHKSLKHLNIIIIVKCL